MALKQASKRVVISSEAVNSYKFRTLTAGIDISQFAKNPIMLFMHQRAVSGKTDDILPLGIVTELRFENGQLTGQPMFDETDEFAMKIYNKFEAGIINMCSPGLLPLKFSDDKKLMQDGQKFPTLTKCQLREVSICDIGSNDDALSFADVLLYGDDGKVLNLMDTKTLNLTIKHKTQNLPVMKVIQLAILAGLLGINLTDNTEEADVTAAILKLKTERDDSVKKLLENEKAQSANEIKSLVDAAVEAKKITPAQREQFVALAEMNFEKTKVVLDGMQSYSPISDAQKPGAKNDADVKELADLSKKTGRELFMEEKFERLRALDPALYKAKYTEYFEKEPEL